MEEEYRNLIKGHEVMDWLREYGESQEALACIETYGISIFKHNISEEDSQLLYRIMIKCELLKKLELMYSSGFEALLAKLNENSPRVSLISASLAGSKFTHRLGLHESKRIIQVFYIS